MLREGEPWPGFDKSTLFLTGPRLVLVGVGAYFCLLYFVREASLKQAQT